MTRTRTMVTDVGILPYANTVTSTVVALEYKPEYYLHNGRSAGAFILRLYSRHAENLRPEVPITKSLRSVCRVELEQFVCHPGQVQNDLATSGSKNAAKVTLGRMSCKRIGANMEAQNSVPLIWATLSTRVIFTASAHTHTRRFGTDVEIFDATLARAPDGFSDYSHRLPERLWLAHAPRCLFLELESVLRQPACNSSVLWRSHSPPCLPTGGHLLFSLIKLS